MYEMACLKLTNVIKLEFPFPFTIFQVDLVMFASVILKQIKELIVVVRLGFLITF